MQNRSNSETLEYEADLVRSAKGGNSESLARLLHSVYPRVYGYILKLCYDRELSSDIVQGAMETAIRRFETYSSEKASFITWISRVAVNLLSDHYRKSRHEVPFDGDYQGEASFQADFEGNAEIEPALARLSPALRMPVVMQYVLGYSQKEIAQILKIPAGTVKSRVHNALVFLKKELGNEEK
jgi:RNA polymerase sigma-70 factor (ECF subfamily)